MNASMTHYQKPLKYLMNNMKTGNIEKIRRACIESNPELADKKLTPMEDMIAYLAELIDRRTGAGLANERNDSEYVKSIFAKPRDLQLADVLLAIINSKHAINPIEISSRDGGTAYLVNYDLDIDDATACWNLLKPLHEQSDDTILFIAGLLK